MAYAISFLLSVILVKVVIAYFFDRTRGSLSKRAYRYALSFCGIGMLAFSAGFAYQAYDLAPQVF